MYEQLKWFTIIKIPSLTLQRNQRSRAHFLFSKLSRTLAKTYNKRKTKVVLSYARSQTQIIMELIRYVWCKQNPDDINLLFLCA